ncbi:hypothetical protein VTN00DRAFT_2162 [Thermoascus crustaceus]|uniref:uncharacterized protein n=1 Tax=Thermoascus crustaceus TaxID=5088 RepID=UPI0037428C44
MLAIASDFGLLSHGILDHSQWSAALVSKSLIHRLYPILPPSFPTLWKSTPPDPPLLSLPPTFFLEVSNRNVAPSVPQKVAAATVLVSVYTEGRAPILEYPPLLFSSSKLCSCRLIHLSLSPLPLIRCPRTKPSYLPNPLPISSASRFSHLSSCHLTCVLRNGSILTRVARSMWKIII